MKGKLFDFCFVLVFCPQHEDYKFKDCTLPLQGVTKLMGKNLGQILSY